MAAGLQQLPEALQIHRKASGKAERTPPSRDSPDKQSSGAELALLHPRWVIPGKLHCLFEPQPFISEMGKTVCHLSFT